MVRKWGLKQHVLSPSLEGHIHRDHANQICTHILKIIIPALSRSRWPCSAIV